VICERGDVVVVPFPFVDVAAQKRRPAIVLSRRAFNDASGHSVCAMVTTAGRTAWSSDIAITDLSSAGLRRACVVRFKLFTLPNAVILRRAGALAETDRAGVFAAAQTIFL
jgi:mRNA interferase MazF